MLYDDFARKWMIRTKLALFLKEVSYSILGPRFVVALIRSTMQSTGKANNNIRQEEIKVYVEY